MIVPEVRKIAVLRANGLGDAIFCLPALEALRAAYPRAEIVLLARAAIGAFLADRPGPVDRAVAVPPSRGVNGPADEDPAALEAFFAQMRAERFDLALQMHGGGRHSNPFVARLGARLTAGLRTPDAAPLDRWAPYDYYRHEVLRWLEVAGLVGARPVTVEPRLAVIAADLAEAGRLLGAGDRPLAVIHPGAGDPRRRWPVQKFAALGDALAGAGLRVTLTGSDAEHELTRAVLAAMAAPADDLGGRLTLGGLAGLLARCRILISNDSGPLHLGGALGAATLGIYWCGNMINAGPVVQARRRALFSWRLECPTCGRSFVDEGAAACDHDSSVVADIPVEAALAAARELIGAAYAPQPPTPAII